MTTNKGDAQFLIGKKLNGINIGRDAVHFALIKVVLGKPAMPGNRVWITGFSETDKTLPIVSNSIKNDGTKSIGILDPFLEKALAVGDQCWVFLTPNTITSLRHVWEHPDFPSEINVPENIPILPPAQKLLWEEKKPESLPPPPLNPIKDTEIEKKKERMKEIDQSKVKQSQIWLANFAEDMGISYENFMESVEEALDEKSDYLTIYGTDAYGDISDEIWKHVEIVLDREIIIKPKYFNCSC